MNRMRIATILSGLGIIAVAIASVGQFTWLKGDNFWTLPSGYPQPVVPVDNLLNEDKIELGRRLFYDQRFSINGSTSCATCHQQKFAFTDGLPVSVGATGELHPRSAMSLVNVAYASRLTWANPTLSQLEIQATVPMFGEAPIEMGLAGKEREIVDLIRSDPLYRDLFPRAFASESDPYSVLSVVRAIAAFVRTIVSFDSNYDRYIGGDLNVMSGSALRGMDLFNSERIECFHCHGGFNFTDSSTHADAIVEQVGFHNTGLYNINQSGRYPDGNAGLIDETGLARDMGRFKAPTLRNIELTAPYMHDGSIATLEEVIAHYARGGRQIEAGPFRGDGRVSPFKSEFVRGFELNAEETADLIAFLQSLTDHSISNDRKFSTPYIEGNVERDSAN